MHFQWHRINGSLTFIPKAASEIATSLENDHKEGKAGREKLKTGESEVQKQLSKASLPANSLPNTSQAVSSLTLRPCRVQPPGRAAGLGIPGRLQRLNPARLTADVQLCWVPLCQIASSSLQRERSGKGAGFSQQCFGNFKLKMSQRRESVNKATKVKERLEISQAFLKDTLKSAMQC